MVCVPGDEPSADLVSCVSCQPGQYSSEGKKCKPCPSGTYAENAKAKKCMACPKDTNAKEGSSSCTKTPDDTDPSGINRL